MDGSYGLLIQARIQREQVLIIRERASASVLHAATGRQMRVTVLLEASSTAGEDDGVGERVYASLDRPVQSLCAGHEGFSGYDVVVCRGQRQTSCSDALHATLQTWRKYLQPGGRIVMQMYRTTADETWRETASRYQQRAAEAGFGLIEVNGFPVYNDRFMSEDDADDSIEIIRTTADRLEDSGDEFGASLLRKTAATWQSRGLEDPLRFDDHLRRQDVLLATFRPGATMLEWPAFQQHYPSSATRRLSRPPGQFSGDAFAVPFHVLVSSILLYERSKLPSGHPGRPALERHAIDVRAARSRRCHTTLHEVYMDHVKLSQAAARGAGALRLLCDRPGASAEEKMELREDIRHINAIIKHVGLLNRPNVEYIDHGIDLREIALPAKISEASPRWDAAVHHYPT